MLHSGYAQTCGVPAVGARQPWPWVPSWLGSAVGARSLSLRESTGRARMRRRPSVGRPGLGRRVGLGQEAGSANACVSANRLLGNGPAPERSFWGEQWVCRLGQSLGGEPLQKQLTSHKKHKCPRNCTNMHSEKWAEQRLFRGLHFWASFVTKNCVLNLVEKKTACTHSTTKRMGSVIHDGSGTPRGRRCAE